MKIAVYCLEWHTIGGSVYDLVVNPLQNQFDIELIPWDGVTLSEAQLRPTADITLWFQFAPVPVGLNAMKNHIWQPMWDNVRPWSQKRWAAIDKSVRIVAFSKAVAEKARQVGLKTLELQYFKNPDEFQPADWSKERVALYWNRTGLVGPKFIEQFVNTLQLDRLLFRGQADTTWVQTATYPLPERIGKTVIENLPARMERDEFWKSTSRANILIAPRLYEGAGMFFLEALARGCAVFAHDAPTMNEYIQHRIDGYLLQSSWNLSRFLYSARVRVAKKGFGGLPAYHFPIQPSKQDWSLIAQTDLAKMGNHAYQNHQQGYQKWMAQIPQYSAFLQDASAHPS